MDASEIQELLESYGENEGVDVRSYSGRGMYGRECIGITGSFKDCMSIVGRVIIAKEGDDDFEYVVEKLMNFSYDSMGLDVVVYWPNLKWEEAEELEEDEE